MLDLPIDVAELSLVNAGAALRAGRYSPLQLTECYLQRIEQLDRRLNSFITVTAESALAAARRATDELASGLDRDPLHGIPIAYKT